MRNITLLNDIMFKYVFGKDTSNPLLIALLNAILNFTGKEKITEIQILNPFIEQESLVDKLVILDIKAKDGKDKLYNIEIQVTPQKSYTQRVVYYLSKLFSGQLEKGDNFTKLSKTIGISILDFVIFEDVQELHNTYRLLNIKTAQELTDIIEFHFIELTKFDKTKSYELRTPIEKWLHILKFGDIYKDYLKEIPKELVEEEGIVMAIDAFRKASASDRLRQLIEGREKMEFDTATRLEEALIEAREKMEFDTATRLEEAKIEGELKGILEGKIEGKIEGKQDTARNLFKLGVDIDTIIKATGLTRKEIENL